MDLSIILPCYNEEEAILSVYEEADNACKGLISKKKLSSYEIIIVDDGSFDRSPELLKSLGSKIKICTHKANKGYGAALKTGILASQGELIALYDLDGTCSAKDLELILPLFESSKAQMVTGTRLSHLSEMPFVRKFGNKLFATLVSILFFKNTKDVCSGYRVLKRSFIKKLIPLLPDRLDFTLKLTLICLIGKIHTQEVDISYKQRMGNSKLNELKEGLRFLSQILNCWAFRAKYRPFLGSQSE